MSDHCFNARHHMFKGRRQTLHYDHLELISHLRHHLLPPRRDMLYSLRPRAYESTLSIRTTSLTETIITIPWSRASDSFMTFCTLISIYIYIYKMPYRIIGDLGTSCKIYFNVTPILCVSGLTVTCRPIRLLTYLLNIRTRANSMTSYIGLLWVNES